MLMIFKKALGDLRGYTREVLLVVLALAIGLWGVGSMGISYYILMRDIDRNFKDTLPPHLVLGVEGLQGLDIQSLRARADVEAAQFRDASMGRIEIRANEWAPVRIFGVVDFDRTSLAHVEIERESPKPPPGGVFIERSGLLISDLDAGVRTRLRVDGRIKEVFIKGVAFDPAQAPATQDHVIYAYTDLSTYRALTGKPIHRRVILRLKGVASIHDVRVMAERIVRDIEAEGIKVKVQDVPYLDEHPHQWQLNTILFLQGSICVLSFLMGAVLVFQLMSSILAKQVRQIGVLRATGASRSAIIMIYLNMLIVLGAAAALLALPLAVATGHAFSRFIAAQLNFNILTTQLPMSMYLGLGVISVLMPIVLSLPVIFKALRISVREALNDYGVAGPARMRRVGSSAYLSGPVLMALRNTLRRKKYLFVTVFSMALGVAVFNTGFNVRQSLATFLANYNNSLRYDVSVRLNEEMSHEQAQGIFDAAGGINRIEAWWSGQGVLRSTSNISPEDVNIVALPFDTDLLHPRIVQGRWLAGEEVPEIVVNQIAMERLNNPRLGERIMLTLGGSALQVKLVGVVEELDKAKLYIDRDFLDKHVNPARLVNTLMIVSRDKDYGAVKTLKGDLERIIAGSQLHVLYVISQAERVKVIYDHLNIILSMILFLAFLVLLVSALGMASTMSVGIMERTREIGVLRATGATPTMIHGLFAGEGMILGAAGVLLGLSMAWPMSILASGFFGNLMLGEGAVLRLSFSTQGLWVTPATTLIFAWLASWIPARAAIRVSPREALSYE